MLKTVVPHDVTWARAFDKEATAITSTIDPCPITLYHIGSTAITGILAKPIIDMLGVVEDLDRLDKTSTALEALGYEGLGPYGIEARRYFRKINESGARTHHLHVFKNGSCHIERHLAFRDYLRQHNTIAAQYSDLKAKLTRGGHTSWGAYLDGKNPFIMRVEQDALRWYRQK